MVLHPSRWLRPQAVTGTKHDRHPAGAVTAQLALRSEPCASCCAVTTVPFRSRAPVMLQEHPDRLFDYVLFRNGYALATRHPGPQRQLVEHPHELVSRKHRIAAVQDAHRRQMGEMAHEPLGLRLHDGGEILGDPGKLAGGG